MLKPTQRLSNLKDVAGRLGKDKWKRAGQIVRDYGIAGLFSRVRDKMNQGPDPAEETERAYLISNESCIPRRRSPEDFPAESMVSFSVEPTADNAAMLEILTESAGGGAMLRVEVFRGGDRLASSSVPVSTGTAYTAIPFVPVFYPEEEPLTFVATVLGNGGIKIDRKRQSRSFSVEGGGRIFARMFASTDPIYSLWMHFNDPTAEELARQREDVIEDGPFFSIAVPIFNTPENYLREMIGSVCSQTYPNWELCLADGSTDGFNREAIAASFEDARIRYAKLERNEGIAGNSNRALELAGGTHICLLDHDDLLSPHALYMNASLLRSCPEYELIYSDEDKITDSGSRRFSPFFKPDWSPNLLDSFNYITHFAVFSRELLRRTGLFREGFDGAQDYDLILRAAEEAKAIGHIPDILYHWRTAPTSTASSSDTKDYTSSAAMRALADSLSRRGRKDAEVVPSIQPNRFDICYAVPDPAPLISVLVPAAGGPEKAADCVQAVLSGSSYPNFEVILVHNPPAGEDEKKSLEEIRRLKGRILTSQCAPDTTISGRINLAAKEASGELFAVVDPGAKAVSEKWLRQLAAHALREDVGAAGGLVISTAGFVVHAGTTLYAGGIAGDAMAGLPCDHPGSYGRLFAVRDVSAVSSSCMMLRRSVFEQMGGFSDKYPAALGDTDLCMRIRQAGYQVVFTPKSRVRIVPAENPGETPEAVQQWLREWLPLCPADPYGNPNLDCSAADYSTYPGPRGQALARALERYARYAGSD